MTSGPRWVLYFDRAVGVEADGCSHSVTHLIMERVYPGICGKRDSMLFEKSPKSCNKILYVFEAFTALCCRLKSLGKNVDMHLFFDLFAINKVPDWQAGFKSLSVHM